MEKCLLLFLVLPSISLAKVPFYYFNHPAPHFQSHGQYQFATHLNRSDLYPEPTIQTECQVGSYCTVDSFCTVNVTISPVALNLTEKEMEERGELIPCWHPESESIQVCCNIPSEEPVVSEDIKDALQCPRIPKAFSESSCSDVASTCGRTGYPDPSCQNNELCCFDGCANRCISDLSPEPEEASTASEMISNFLSTSHGGSYSSLPYRQYPVNPYYSYYQPSSPYHQTFTYHSVGPSTQASTTTPPPTTTTTPSPRRPFKAIFSPSYSVFTSGSRPAIKEPSVPSRTRFTHSYSNQQFFGYVRPLAPSSPVPPPQTHEALRAAPVQHTVEPHREPRPYYYEQPYATAYAPAEETPLEYTPFELPPSTSSSHQPCPSAMKCIPKKNCDFNGVIVSYVVSTSPEFDVVRVPLMSCSGSIQTEDPYVCCRDPNHVDVYPY